jgi:hypothetical protein
MAKVSFTKAQRDRAKADGKKLCAIHTPHVSFDGPCTEAEHEEIVRFMHDFMQRRLQRLRREREESTVTPEGE